MSDWPNVLNQAETQSRIEPGPRARVAAGALQLSWWLAAPVAALLIFCACAGTPESPAVWRHLSTGRTIAESGLPKHDPFTILGAQRVWANPSWLFDLALYFVHVAGGDAGLIVARFLLVAALAIVLLLPTRRDGGVTAVLPVVVAVPALQDALSPSPMLIGLIVLGMFAATLDRCEERRSTSTLAWLAVIQVLWTNTSSTFIFGPLIVMLRWLGAALDDWSAGSVAASRASHVRNLWALLAIGVASIASPFGPAGIQASWIDCFAAFAIAGDGQSLVPGLAPLWSVAWPSWSAVAFLSLLATAFLSGLFPAIRFRSLLATMFLAVLGIADVRLLPLAGVWLVLTIQQGLAGAFLQEHAPQATTRGTGRTRWLLGAATIVAAVCVGSSVAGPARDGLRRIDRQLRGTAVVQMRNRWLSQGEITGVVLPLDPSDAGWLVWGNAKLRPMLDDRRELFADKYSTYRRLCLDVAQDRHNSYRRTDGSLGGWRQLANVVTFDWIVTRSTDMETNMMLNSSPHWGPVYWDAEVIIFGNRQNERVAAAATRLKELRSLGIHGVDHIPFLDPNRPEGYLLILDERSWKNYTTREFVELARVYHALDVPEIAAYLVMRLDDPRLVRETDDWLHWSNTQLRRRTYELQDSIE